MKHPVDTEAEICLPSIPSPPSASPSNPSQSTRKYCHNPLLIELLSPFGRSYFICKRGSGSSSSSSSGGGGSSSSSGQAARAGKTGLT